MFALDVPDLGTAKSLVARLADSVAFYKIGLELATSPHYFELLHWLLEHDKKVFTDLKLYDIPATVAAAVRQISKTGASFLTVHGDRAIMEAAAGAKGDHLKILVVTVLGTIVGADRWRRASLQETLAGEMRREAVLLGAALPHDPAQLAGAARRLASQANRRMTVVDSTGRVLGDSEFDDESLALLDNHLTRPEISCPALPDHPPPRWKY